MLQMLQLSEPIVATMAEMTKRVFDCFSSPQASKRVVDFNDLGTFHVENLIG